MELPISPKDNVYDYIIIGQGLCGTFLSWSLIKAGKKVLVIDDCRPFTSTKVASGIINPVTGRRIVKTWRIDELLPFSLMTYKELGSALGVELIRQCNIIDFHPTLQMKEAFEKRLTEKADHLLVPSNVDYWKQYFNFHFGAGEINPCYLIDLNVMLDRWREQLRRNQYLLEETFNWDSCTINQEDVCYKNMVTKKIIFCEGVAGFNNPYFKNLPYSRMKGEAIIADIKGLPKTHIYKQGLSIVPWKNNLFWIGSSYDWNFTDILPTNSFRQKVENQLKYFLKLPFKVMEHVASERPANMERRPFVGLHPQQPSVGVFNGMGTKGCSLAPFFADQFANHLIHATEIYPDADVRRFKKVLQRAMD